MFRASRSKYESTQITATIHHPIHYPLEAQRTRPPSRQQFKSSVQDIKSTSPLLTSISNTASSTIYLHITMPTNVVIPSTARQQPQPERGYEVERDIKAKFVPSPQKLLEELRRVVGPEEYYSVEMRHNVYKIRASTDFDMQELISSF